MKELMIFENTNVEIILNEKGEPLFELYSTGMALGYVNKRTAKGRLYISPYKSRIDRVMENAEITGLCQEGRPFINLEGLRKFITIANTKNKQKFIDWLKENEFIDYKEVFGTETKETVFFNSLRKVLKPLNLTLKQQYIDGIYRIDGFIPELDFIIEYDENGHTHYDKDKEEERETYLKNKYKHFVRLTDFKDLYTNIGIVISKIMEVK